MKLGASVTYTDREPARSHAGVPRAPSVDFGVERGGLVAASSTAGGGATATTVATVQPWWCVCRQFLSAADAGVTAVPLLDAYADLDLLGLVETTVGLHGGDLRANGERGDEAWRVAFWA